MFLEFGCPYITLPAIQLKQHLVFGTAHPSRDEVMEDGENLVNKLSFLRGLGEALKVCFAGALLRGGLREFDESTNAWA